MQAIGMRMIKTSIAVFLCFMIYLCRGAGIPFYSAIAAVLCMQPELDDAKAKGKSRIIATFIGGFAGMLMLFFFQQYLKEAHDLLRYTLISLTLIPLIYLTVWIKQPSTSYLTCVVFMCICVSHAGDSEPLVFAINRMIDTLIGIFVALFVNAFHLPHRKHTDLLIEVPLSYLLENGTLSTHTRIHLNRFLKEGMQLMITSAQTPSYLSSHISMLRDNAHYILMDGVLYYHQKEQICEALHEIPYAIWSKIQQMILENEWDSFLYEVSDEVLYIHHGPYTRQSDLMYYHCLKKDSGVRFVTHEKTLTDHYHGNCIMLMLLLPLSDARRLEEQLQPFMQTITWVLYDSEQGSDLKELRIYSAAIAQADPSQYVMEKLSLKRMEKIRTQAGTNAKEVIMTIEHLFYHGE